MESLSSILKEYKIEIPVIQRDYVQGRKDNKAQKIRKRFVEDLFENVARNNNKIQHLDFIYGRVIDDLNTESTKKNYDSVEQLLTILHKYRVSLNVSLSGDIPSVDRRQLLALNKKILPLDGQQRLTTLWLFHFVIAHQLNVMPEWMGNFSYKTRKSSRDFCKKLMEKQNKLIVCESYSEVIDNQNWFFYKWKNDPTIKGMLIMLDEILSQLQKQKDWYANLQKIWNRLTIEKKVAFSFLSLDEHNIDDEIYIKMNARGKELADFEIFKNSLLDLIDSEEYFCEEEIKIYAHKLDTKWLDLFWKNKLENVYDIQDDYYNFFGFFFLYEYISQQKNEGIDLELIKFFLKNKDERSKYNDLSFDELVNKNVISRSGIVNAFEYLNLFEEKEIILQFSVWLNDLDYTYDLNSFNKQSPILLSHFTSIAKDMGYYDRTFFLAIIFYIKENQIINDDSELKFKKHARALYNIIYNQNYIQNPETFILALRTVRKLAIRDIDLLLEALDFKSIRFKNSLLEEENVKFKLIKLDSTLEKEFVKVEKHEYFRGQIGFIIELSGGVDNFDIETFIDYRDKLMMLFSEKWRTSKSKVFERSLLAQKNYFINKGIQRWMFCDSNLGLRFKEEGWRIVFANCQDELRTVLDNIDLNDLDNTLELIIEKYSGSSWRSYFINNADIWKFCNNRMLKKNEDGTRVRLLQNTIAGGTQRELRTKYFELEFKKQEKILKPFESLNYYDAKKEDEEPCAFFHNWMFESKSYFWDIRFFNGMYELNFSYRDQRGTIDFSDEILNILKSYKYEVSTKYDYTSYIKIIESDSDLSIHVDVLLKKFVSITELAKNI